MSYRAYTSCGRSTGNGTVEFEEFLAMMSRRLVATANDDDQAKRQRQEAELRQAFRVFDIDGDGLIDADELRQTMANLGETLSEHDVQTMIREADRNGDGKVDFDGMHSTYVYSVYVLLIINVIQGADSNMCSKCTMSV